MHVVELKDPVLLLANVTVPVGVIAPAPDESATVTVQVVAEPTFTDEGKQLTLADVDLIVDVTRNAPLLPL